MDAKNYPPLKLLAKSEQPGKEFLFRKKQFMNLGVRGADKLTVESYIDVFLSDLFMVPRVKHPFMDIDDAFYQNVHVIADATGLSPQQLLSDGGEQFRTEVKDLYLAPVLLDEWAKSKQVYKPDRDFAKALLRTQKLQMTRDMLTHLPYNNFYIDLLDCEYFKPIVGIFVFVHHKNNFDSVDLSVYILTEDLVYFSHYITGRYDSKGVVRVTDDLKANADYTVYDKEAEITYSSEDFEVDRNEVTIFVLQLLCYLSIEKPQIEESEQTKHTYKPKPSGAMVKNKWNEVRIFDVGVSYGKMYRKQVEEYRNKKTDDSDVRHHRSPIPHMRCAHWHRYWVGQGRKECKINWIEPTFVGAKDSANVVIHKVSEGV